MTINGWELLLQGNTDSIQLRHEKYSYYWHNFGKFEVKYENPELKCNSTVDGLHISNEWAARFQIKKETRLD